MIRASLTSGALGRFFFGTWISAEIVGDSGRNGEDGIGSAVESPGNSGAWSEVSKMQVLGRVYSEMNKSNQGIRYCPRASNDYRWNLELTRESVIPSGRRTQPSN
ncbi:hypothetical protein DFH08DRAFT_827403 [Mycena albidolilacea]|uniref:Uncharacterized protein n=1 Tax=Mycena albidolilacea TaxID=1033008 RepID=A0AAD6YY83_9AGAR|nr:hypothetical protein DFH08DRAFT_827403 [Mycena albidolilacea]